MQSSYKFVKNLSYCLHVHGKAFRRFLANRNISFGGTGQWLHSNGRIATVMQEPQNKPRFQQLRRYEGRFDWREAHQGRVQSGMDAKYTEPEKNSKPVRFDDVFPEYQSTMHELMDKETFDPRHNQFHYNSYKREEQRQQKEAQRKLEMKQQREHSASYRPMKSREGDMSWPEASGGQRSLQQDPLEYQKRQTRIIEENKRKWMQRGAIKSLNNLNDDMKKRVQLDIKDYRNERREAMYGQGVKENHSAYREADRHAYAKAEEDDDGYLRAGKSPYASKAWMEKKALADEENHWHSWKSCPNERNTYKRDEYEPYPDVATSFETLPQGKGLVRPPKPYGGSRRRFRTSSSSLSATQLSCKRASFQWEVPIKKPLKQMKMKKQFYASDRFAAEKGFSGPRRMHKVPNRYESIDEAMDDSEPFVSYKRKQDRIPKVKPPRFCMALKYSAPTRKRVPMASLSEKLIANTWGYKKSAQPICSSQWGTKLICQAHRPDY